jgi:hypothetical protein
VPPCTTRWPTPTSCAVWGQENSATVHQQTRVQFSNQTPGFRRKPQKAANLKANPRVGFPGAYLKPGVVREVLDLADSEADGFLATTPESASLSFSFSRGSSRRFATSSTMVHSVGNSISCRTIVVPCLATIYFRLATARDAAHFRPRKPSSLRAGLKIEARFSHRFLFDGRDAKAPRRGVKNPSHLRV